MHITETTESRQFGDVHAQKPAQPTMVRQQALRHVRDRLSPDAS
jgi:hypothetical protein